MKSEKLLRAKTLCSPRRKSFQLFCRQALETYGISSSYQLIDLAEKLKIKLNFIGMTHHLKRTQVCNGCYIFNIGDTVGTHWVAAYIKDDTMFYFDSFAVPPEDDLIEIVDGKLKTIIYNSDFQFQNIDETLCGIWCIFFLMSMNQSKKPLIERFNEFKKSYSDLS